MIPLPDLVPTMKRVTKTSDEEGDAEGDVRR